MTSSAERTRTRAIIEELCGPWIEDPAADRAVAVMHAHAAALAWVRDTTGAYPSPASVAAELERVSWPLRTGEDDRDPVAVLSQTAAEALAAHMAGV
jgi:hypothetical protein